MSLPDRKTKKKFNSNISHETKTKGKDLGSTLPNSATGRRSKINRNRSIKQEDRIADKMGGYRVPGSGSISGKDGDVDVYEKCLTSKDGVVFNGFKIEAKTTKKSSFRIDKKLIEKTFNEAISAGMDMAIAIEVLGIKGAGIPDKFVITTEDSFSQILAMARAYNKGEDDE